METGQKVPFGHRLGHFGGQNVAIRFEHFLRFLLLRRRQRSHIRLELGFDLFRHCTSLPSPWTTLSIAAQRADAEQSNLVFQGSLRLNRHDNPNLFGQEGAQRGQVELAVRFDGVLEVVEVGDLSQIDLLHDG